MSLAPILVILASLLWSLDGLLRRSLFVLPPLTLVTIEHILGFILILPLALAKKSPTPKPSLKDGAAFVWISLVSGIIGTTLYTAALAKTNYVPFSIVVLLQQLQPIFVVLSARLILKEKLSPRFFLLLFLGLLGAYLVTFKNLLPSLDSSNQTLPAALMAIGAAAAWGGSTAISRFVLVKYHTLATTSARFLLTAIFGLGILLVTGQLATVTEVSLPQLQTLLLIALSTGLVAMIIYYAGLSQVPAKVSAVLELTWPLSAMALDAFVLKSGLAPTQYFGAILLMFAMFLVTKTQSPPRLFTAKVIKGKGRGKGLGFPTLNLEVPPTFSYPFGIYAGWVYLKGKKMQGAFHYGPVPTFKEGAPSLEAFVLNASIETAPPTITFELIQYLRPVENFTSPKTLTQQIAKDVSQTKKLLS